MVSTFRMYGPKIGVGTAIVDADVTGVTISGSVELTPQDGNHSQFTLTSDKISELVSEGLAYDKDAIDKNDPVWKAIEDLENRYNNDEDNTDHYFDAARTLFSGGP